MQESSAKKQITDPNKRNKKIGLILILSPFVGLVAVLAIYAIAVFVIASVNPATGSVASGSTGTSLGLAGMIGGIVRTGLGLLGVIFVIWMFIGVPLGIIYLLKKSIPLDGVYDKRSGTKGLVETPPEVKKWSWGGFGIPIFWGVYHSVWISLLCFIPIVNFGMMIYLGIKGNELAWQRNTWKSVEDFHRSQRRWGVVGAIFILILTPLVLLSGLARIGDLMSVQPRIFSPAVLETTPENTSGIIWTNYTSVDGGFVTSFPNAPTRDSKEAKDADGSSLTTLTYTAMANETSYYVFVNDFTNPNIDETLPGFDVSAALEAKLNSMLSFSAEAKLIGSQKTTFLDKTALRYQIALSDQVLDGVVFMKDHRLYNVAVDYFTSVTPLPTLAEFTSHFSFL